MPEWVFTELETISSNNNCSPVTIILGDIIRKIHSSIITRSFGFTPRFELALSEDAVKSICENVPKVINEYLTKNKNNVCHYDSNNRQKWLYVPNKRFLVGRFSRNLDDVKTISIAWEKLCKFVESKGVTKYNLRYWLEMQKSEFKTVQLHPGTNNSKYCVNITINSTTESLIDLTFLSRSAGLSLAD